MVESGAELRPGRLVLMGGLDPSGGAGLLRDFLSARARGFRGDVRCVPTAFTLQGDGRPARAQAVLPERFESLCERAQLFAPNTVVKLGLLSAGALAWLIEGFEAHPKDVPRVVFDPVNVASDGGHLGEALGVTREATLALSTHVSLMTPNRAELNWLTGHEVEEGSGLAALRARGLMSGPGAWLLKNCGGLDDEVEDRLLVPDSAPRVWCRKRSRAPDPRGTGCALATAISVELACGAALGPACATAIEWLDKARQSTRVGRDGCPHIDNESAATA